MKQNNEKENCSQCIKLIEDNKNTINMLCSFLKLFVQGNVPLLFRKSGFHMENIFNIIINEDGTLDITVHDILITSNNKNPIKILRVAIEEKRLFLLRNRKKKNMCI